MFGGCGSFSVIHTAFVTKTFHTCSLLVCVVHKTEVFVEKQLPISLPMKVLIVPPISLMLGYSGGVMVQVPAEEPECCGEGLPGTAEVNTRLPTVQHGTNERGFLE